MFKKCSIFIILFFIFQILLFAQTHIAVPLGNPVYTVLEQAQLRGLCNILPSAKPYSREQIISVIQDILDNEEERRFGRLSDSERKILEQFKNDFSPKRGGRDWTLGSVSTEHTWKNFYFSVVLDFDIDFIFAGGFYPKAGGYQYTEGDDIRFSGAEHPSKGDFYWDFTFLPTALFSGDLGKYVTYGFTIGGIMLRSPRTKLGMNNYDIDNDNPTIDKLHTTYSDPLAYFPFTYKKRWDGFVWAINDVSNSSQLAWPHSLSIGYTMLPELSADLLGGRVFLRFARIDREWAGMTTNGSLILNQSAQPFLAFETVINPFQWISISSLTGVLEYSNAVNDSYYSGLKENAKTFQNAFSIVQLEFNIKNYFNIGFGSSVVWPKRFELGYPFPFAENFLYQNDIGDFDNLAMFLNLQGQYPGIGKLWFSFFLDEANPESDFFKLDRMMYTYQLGGSFNIPGLPFSSVTLSYTKVEPYTYTHTRDEVPWYIHEMETNYVSFGRSLGYYIPPNSDEILVRFDTIPFAKSMFSIQYQLIRHGADYGDRAVDGS